MRVSLIPALLALAAMVFRNVPANAAPWPFNSRGIEYPKLRYTPWSLLEADQKESAEILGCT